jgi:hypothetical protein
MGMNDFGTCSFCGTGHEDPNRMLRCLGCGGVICSFFAIDGKRWNRPGEKVHVGATRTGTFRACGLLVAVPLEDAAPAASDAVPEAIAPADGSTVEQAVGAAVGAMAAPGE